MGQDRGRHVLATVLFTDIVDSSSIARELGDRRWRVLLGRHHTIVRKALKRFGGKEIDNAGDGFFASFDDQVDAIRSACAISDGVRALGIDVRAGLHVGQAEVLGKKLGGVVVHTGARVMAEADPGEVLVSSVMKELVPGSGFTFVDRGARHLKGMDGDWELFAVTGVDGTPRPVATDPAEAARLREAIQPPPLVERRSGRVGIAILGLVLAIAIAFLALNRPEPAHAVRVQPNSLAKIDTNTNAIVWDVPVAAPGLSQLTAVPPDEVWVLSQEKQVITIVNTTTGEVAPVPVSVGEAPSLAGVGIVYAAGDIWVTGGRNQIVEFSKTGTGVRAPLTIPALTGPDRAAYLAARDGRVWATADNGHHVVAINSASGRKVGTAKTHVLTANGIGVGEGSVWVTDYRTGIISKIDPRSVKETDWFRVGVRMPVEEGGDSTYFEPGGLGEVTTGFGSVWVSDIKLGLVYRIDPATDKIRARIRVGEPSLSFWGDILNSDGSIWVTSPNSKTIVRIDPSTDAVEATIPLSFIPAGLTASEGAVWVAINQ